jgi:hypothetical protein
MRVRAGVAPRVEPGDRAASKGKSAGGCSSFKRRVDREERCAAPQGKGRGKGKEGGKERTHLAEPCGHRYCRILASSMNVPTNS